ncbi:alpha/beta hydrolase [Ectothiorhodospiraceae bacterium WFHF3C12]|nr:alpha/beta hydrolase [Ectothiorhodospiraceae bacterium WFHF3C12]
MRVFLVVATIIVAGFAAAAALAIILGGPETPEPVAAINDPFEAVDYANVPPLRRYTARDGEALGYRAYPPADRARPGSVVLIHGSSANSRSMHPLSRALAGAGYRVYALDVRGHGSSGPRGDIDYIGQLEDDLADFLESVSPEAPRTLIGFSSGGGFALRFAGSERQTLFAGYLLLAPFISQDASTSRDDAGGWVSVGLPRYIAIAILNGFGVKAFNHLPVIRYALAEEARAHLTPAYSFALAENFRPRQEYRANIRAVNQPVRVVAGEADELFHAARFGDVFALAGKDVPVRLVPGIGHVGLTLEPAGIRAVRASLGAMHGNGRGRVD